MKYKDRLARVAGSNYLKVPRGFIQKLSVKEAILLAELINISDWKIRLNLHRTNWVAVPSRMIQERLGWSAGQVKRCLRNLLDKKIIKTRLLGRDLPKIRHIKLNVRKVGELEKTASQDRRQNRQTGSLKTDKAIAQNRQTGSLKTDNPIYIRKRTKKKRTKKKKNTVGASQPTEFVLLGRKLRDTVASEQNISKRNGTKTWSAPIEKVHRIDGFPIESIKEVLTWYCKVLPLERAKIKGGEISYVPHVMSGAAFRKKFSPLLTSMIKAQGQRKKKEPKGPSVWVEHKDGTRTKYKRAKPYGV